MVKLSELIDLHASFHSIYGEAPDLVSYLARPRIPQKLYNYWDARQTLINRIPKSEVPQIGWAPQDQNLMLLRYDLLANNNQAYEIAMKNNPSAEDCEIFSSIRVTWSTLFAVKSYLMDHPETARKYRGFLPYGSEVAKYANSLTSKPWEIPLSSQSLRDHVWLREISNNMADFLNMPTVEINNFMYLKGLKIVD